MGEEGGKRGGEGEGSRRPWPGKAKAAALRAFRAPTPSISVRIWLITRSPASDVPAPPPRALAIESISSKKITHGDACRATMREGDEASARAGERSEWPSLPSAPRDLPGLVKELAHVGLRLPKPHREQLGSLHRDEIGLSARTAEPGSWGAARAVVRVRRWE